MTRPTTIAIPKTASRPADPSALSFLTLPGELRNKVYGYLLHQDGPVVLHDIWRYREEIGKAQNDGRRLSTGEQQELAHLSKVCFEEETYQHGFQGSTSILQTCRQVYHEAASVLYYSNEVSFPLVRIPRVCTHGMLLHFVAKWLFGIGTQLGLLRKAIIHMRPFQDGCSYCRTRGKLDILPILKLVWVDASINTKIEFIVNSRHPASANRGRLSPDSGILFTTFCNLLVTLGNNDTLDLKRYMISRRLMSAVNITAAYLRGGYTFTRPSVIFGEQTSSQSNDSIVRQFKILDHGNITQWKPRNQAISTPLNLPENVRCTIFQYVTAPDGEVVLDLESETVFALDFLIDEFISWDSDVTTAQDPKFTFKMGVESGSVTARSDDALESWTNKYDFKYIRFRDNITHINFLHVDIEHDRMGEVFMDINEVGYTMHEIARTNFVNCRASSKATTGSGEGTLWSVHKIQQADFMIFSDILMYMPEKASDPVPTVLINGNFDTVRVVYSATSFSAAQIVECSFTAYEVEHFHRLGREKVQWLEHQMRTDWRASDLLRRMLNDRESTYSMKYGTQHTLATMWAAVRPSALSQTNEAY